MKCPNCGSSVNKNEAKKLIAGESRYICTACGTQFQTAFNQRWFPKGVAIFVACSFIFGFLPAMIEIPADIVVGLLIYLWANEPIVIESNEDKSTVNDA